MENNDNNSYDTQIENIDFHMIALELKINL